MQMSVILCSHGLLDWFNKAILFYTINKPISVNHEETTMNFKY